MVAPLAISASNGKISWDDTVVTSQTTTLAFVETTNAGTFTTPVTHSVTFKAECGASSTKIEAPVVATQTQETGADATISVSGLVFKNSNSACPWNSVAVDSTTPNFEVVEQTGSNGLSSFTLKLKSSVKDTAGTYNYKVKGTSAGGAEAILTGSMTIT